MRKGSFLKNSTKLRMVAETVLTVSPACVLNYAAYKIRQPQPEIKLSRCGPVSASILVNRRCNLNCPWCVNGTLSPGLNLRDFDMNTERMKRLLLHPAVKRCLYIGLTGGEPLLNEKIAEIVRLVRKYGHIAGIVTNGILLRDRIRELKQSGVNQVSVSVYHAQVNALSDILPEANRVLPARTTAILQRSELENTPGKIEEIIRLSYESGCRGTVLTFLFPQGGDREEVVYDDNPAYKDLKRRMTEKYPKYPLYWPAPLVRTPSRKDKKCRMPWFFIIVDARGNLGLCCNYPPDPAGRYGNLFDSSAEKALNLFEARELRTGLLPASPGVPAKCRDCFIISDKWLSDV
ncbi:MAG: radical SAM protein [Candidatus Omnitrophota bacterium]